MIGLLIELLGVLFSFQVIVIKSKLDSSKLDKI
jgi:hypothetical protein